MVNLQAQLAYLREQAAQSCLNVSATENPNEEFFGKPTVFPQDLQNWLQMENSNTGPQFLANLSSYPSTTQYYGNSTSLMDPNPIGNYENSSISFSSFDESCNSVSFDMQRQWAFHEVDDLQ